MHHLSGLMKKPPFGVIPPLESHGSCPDWAGLWFRVAGGMNGESLFIEGWIGMSQGRKIKLTAGRKVVMEILHHARQVPSITIGMTLDVAGLMLARKAGPTKVAWTSIFLRAFGIASQRCPDLRRSYMKWPYPHLYEHPFSQGVAMIEREWDDETVILGGRFKDPEHSSLFAIDERLSGMRTKPVWEVSCFRQQLRLGRLPGWARRFVFWHSLYLLGSKRSTRFGTFAISSLGNMGIEQIHALTPLTSYFTYGPISSSGEVSAKFIFDHRVMDGRDGARCLLELQKVLNTEVLQELRSAQRAAA